MNRYVRPYSWSAWAGFLLILFLALPGIFHPAATADFIGVKPPAEPIWLAFAWLLLFIIGWFHVAAAVDPLRRLPTCFVVVLLHLALGVFWLSIYRAYHAGPILWLALIELALGVVQLALFVMTVEGSTRLDD